MKDPKQRAWVGFPESQERSTWGPDPREARKLQEGSGRAAGKEPPRQLWLLPCSQGSHLLTPEQTVNACLTSCAQTQSMSGKLFTLAPVNRLGSRPCGLNWNPPRRKLHCTCVSTRISWMPRCLWRLRSQRTGKLRTRIELHSVNKHKLVWFCTYLYLFSKKTCWRGGSASLRHDGNSVTDGHELYWSSN